MLVLCEHCGKEFNKSKRDIKRTKHNFCCKECYKKYRASHRMKIYCKHKQLDKIITMGKLRKQYLKGEIDKKALNEQLSKFA